MDSIYNSNCVLCSISVVGDKIEFVWYNNKDELIFHMQKIFHKKVDLSICAIFEIENNYASALYSSNIDHLRVWYFLEKTAKRKIFASTMHAHLHPKLAAYERRAPINAILNINTNFIPRPPFTGCEPQEFLYPNFYPIQWTQAIPLHTRDVHMMDVELR